MSCQCENRDITMQERHNTIHLFDQKLFYINYFEFALQGVKNDPCSGVPLCFKG